VKSSFIIAISTIMIALAVGSLDYDSIGGSTSLLNPAAAIATVIAFIALVTYEEGSSGELHREVLKGSLLAAVALDLAKTFSLVTGALIPEQLRMSVIWLGIGLIERKEITLFATQPFPIGPVPFEARALALDPVPLILLGYYWFAIRRKANKSQPGSPARRAAVV